MNDQGKFRKKRKNYSQVSNVALTDKNLSLKAKGLYALIESFISIPDFILYKQTLINACKEGRDAFNAAWKELKDEGYLVQYKIQNPNTKDKEGNRAGGFTYEYELLDEPASKNPSALNNEESSTYGFSVPGNTTHGTSTSGKATSIINTNSNNTNENNTEENYIVINNNDVDYINSVIDTTNLTNNEVNELANKIQKDQATLKKYKDSSFNAAYFMRSWAAQKFRNEVIYRYDIPQEEYLLDTRPTDKAEILVLDVLSLDRYNNFDLNSIEEHKALELFNTALGLINGEIRANRSNEAYLIGTVDNIVKSLNNRP